MAGSSVTTKDRERFTRARARGQMRAQDPSAVVEARYDETRDAIDLRFRSGGSMTIPRQIVPGLENAPPVGFQELGTGPFQKVSPPGPRSVT
jgi:hypothetical protein